MLRKKHGWNKHRCGKKKMRISMCFFNQKWFWISTSCRGLWVRMPGRGFARLCSNSTTTKTTRNWPIAYLLFAHLLILERNSQNLTPWTRMVSKCFQIHVCAPLFCLLSALMSCRLNIGTQTVFYSHQLYNSLHVFCSVSVCDIYCCSIFHFLLLFVFLSCVCV